MGPNKDNNVCKPTSNLGGTKGEGDTIYPSYLKGGGGPRDPGTSPESALQMLHLRAAYWPSSNQEIGDRGK